MPFTIKENVDCVGTATTNGVAALAGAMPAEDAPVPKLQPAQVAEVDAELQELKRSIDQL